MRATTVENRSWPLSSLLQGGRTGRSRFLRTLRMSSLAKLLAEESTAAMPRADREQINLYWLIRLRWAAALGQLLTLAVTRYLFGIEIAFGTLLTIVALGALSNLGCAIWYGYATRHDARLVRGATGEMLMGAVLVFDLLLLTVLLYFSGGPANPFSIFYIVSISLAAAVLRPLWAWSLTVLAAGCFAILFAWHIPVAALSHHGATPEPAPAASHAHGMHHHDPIAAEPMALHLRGMLVAFAGAAGFVAYFVTRVRSELNHRDQQLAEAERRKAKAERLDSLITLAAGAAHELASPLATIAVIARELELGIADLPANHEARDDVNVIRNEVEKCRAIIGSLSTQAGANMGESWSTFTLEELFTTVLENQPWTSVVRSELPANLTSLRLKLPRQALVQSLRSLLKNAWEASSKGALIHLSVADRAGELWISVEDHGSGVRPDILARIGEPFLTSKPHGSGLGLGLFLARRVLEQLGGRLEIESYTGRGTTVSLVIPPHAVEKS